MFIRIVVLKIFWEKLWSETLLPTHGSMISDRTKPVPTVCVTTNNLQVNRHRFMKESSACSISSTPSETKLLQEVAKYNISTRGRIILIWYKVIPDRDAVSLWKFGSLDRIYLLFLHSAASRIVYGTLQTNILWLFQQMWCLAKLEVLVISVEHQCTTELNFLKFLRSIIRCSGGVLL